MAGDETARERDCLVEHLRETGQIRSMRVERAMRAVPREAFVPASQRDRAYEDTSLDVGHDQVISAPHIVARMSELLELHPGLRVLEVGTGTGYHAAVTAEIVGADNVFTVERIPEFVERARRTLAQAGYDAVTVVEGDGSRGLAAHAPYDRIYLTCAAPDVPRPLKEQLVDGGRLVLPIGRTSQAIVVEKRGGTLDRTTYDPVRFVPLVGEHGFES